MRLLNGAAGRALGMLSAALVLHGCTTTNQIVSDEASSRKNTLQQAKAKFPTTEYVVSIEEDSTPGKAEEKARLGVAKQIKSQIEASTENRQTVGRTGSETSNSETTTTALLEKIQSDDGELIIAQQDFTSASGSTFTAVATAKKADLDAKWAREGERALQNLALAHDRVKKAAAGSGSEVATAVCAAQVVIQQLEDLENKRAAITHHETWTAEARAQASEIKKVQSQAKGTRIAVVRNAVLVGQDVSDAIVKRLGSAGYPGTLVGKSGDCSAGGVLIRVTVDENCNSTVLGQRCEVQLSAVSNRCSQSEELFSIRSDKNAALHASDATIASAAAKKKVNVTKFVDEVSQNVLRILEGGCTK